MKNEKWFYGLQADAENVLRKEYPLDTFQTVYQMITPDRYVEIVSVPGDKFVLIQLVKASNSIFINELGRTIAAFRGKDKYNSVKS